MSWSVGFDPEFEIKDTNGGHYDVDDMCNEKGAIIYGRRGHGLGTDGRAMEFRGSQGWTSLKEAHREVLHEFGLFKDAIEKDHYDEGDPWYEVRSGSGSRLKLGGHLHCYWYEVIDEFRETMGERYNFWKPNLSILVPIMFAVEDHLERSWHRRTSYGQPFSMNTDGDCRGRNGTNMVHIEWRMPFSFFHSVELFNGVMGMWCWWCDTMDKNIRTFNTSKGMRTPYNSWADEFNAFTYNIEDWTHGDYDEDDEYGCWDVDEDRMDEYRKFHDEATHLAKHIVNEGYMQKINPDGYKKWGSSIRRMIRTITEGGRYSEDKDVLDIWKFPKSKVPPPPNTIQCNSCGLSFKPEIMIRTARGNNECNYCLEARGAYKQYQNGDVPILDSNGYPIIRR